MLVVSLTICLFFPSPFAPENFVTSAVLLALMKTCPRKPNTSTSLYFSSFALYCVIVLCNDRLGVPRAVSNPGRELPDEHERRRPRDLGCVRGRGMRVVSPCPRGVHGQCREPHRRFLRLFAAGPVRGAHADG